MDLAPTWNLPCHPIVLECPHHKAPIPDLWTLGSLPYMGVRGGTFGKVKGRNI